MGPKSSFPPPLLLFLSSFLLFSSAAQAFNITRLLGQFPDFSTFNSYLSQTNVSIGINRRQTITVLAVENGAIAPITGKSLDDIKNILRLHVILDYYDDAKLHKLSNKTALLTTLLQATGQANGQHGFLNVTELSSGQVVFGSAVAGSGLQAKLVKTVASQPYNISVLQISTPILAPGVGGVVAVPVTPPPSGSPAAAPKAAEGPGASKTTPSPAPSTPPPAKAPSAEAPAPSDDSAEAPSDADAPAADGPEADAPAADAPLSSPPMPAADGPIADGPVADGSHADAPSAHRTSGATQVAIGTCLAVVMPFVSILFDL
ncbi:hypothetical protein PVL29_004095 [Vitis rotundifolia]|uniref:FAS1 domain-containing protein n=1 Tax=Vitis rotundifolia TaxID=103349 RepID=A0AA39E1Z9_VITRO|nr:hypothetical protein PVL29_004095 [Vitis rotundifolia]